MTVTVDGGANEEDDEDAGVRPDAMTALLVVGGLMAMGWNLL